MRNRNKASLGSVSCATMLASDLIPTFASALDDFKPLTREHRALVREANRLDDFDGEDSDGILESLFDALDSYAPDYCYFGAHQGDGADYGFWPSWGSIDDDIRTGEILKVADLSEVPRDYVGTIAHANDHGNVTLYAKRGKRGKLHELWSVV